MTTQNTTPATQIPDYLFEPGREVIIRELIPKTLRIQLIKAVLDSFASELGARMTAMQKATENAKVSAVLRDCSWFVRHDS